MVKTFWGHTTGRRMAGPWHGMAVAITVGAGACASSALAQSAPAAPPAGISDSAKRAAESPYRWILINADNAGNSGKAPAAAAKPATDTKVDSAKSRAADKAAPGLAPPMNAAKPAAPKDDQPATATGLINTPLPVDPLPAVSAVPAQPAVAKASEPIMVAKLDESARTAALPRVPSALVVLTQTPPQLPTRMAREMVMAESIKVQFTVMPDGSVNNPLVTASTNRRMNSYVLTAVGQWRYAPIVEARLQEVEFAFKPE